MTTALVLSYWNLNDPRTGGLQRVNALLDAIGSGVTLCQPGDPHPQFNTVPLKLDLGRRKRIINWGMFNFFWPANSKLVHGLIEKEKPSVIVLTSTWAFAPLREHHDIPIVLDAHDVNAVAIGERYGVRHPFTTLVRRWEARVVQRANHVFACSDVDRAKFIELYGVPGEKVSVAPNGIDVPESIDEIESVPIPQEYEEKLKDSTALLFVGGMGYQPNRKAFDLLNSVIMPELERKYPGQYRLVICGGTPPGQIHPSIVVVGRVDDALLRGYLKRADMCLAPITTGSGTRLKILEYMAARRLVIATPKGAEGLACEHGKDIVIAEPDAFCDSIVELASDPDRARALAEMGYKLVSERYDWDVAAKPVWRDVLGRWLDVDGKGSVEK